MDNDRGGNAREIGIEPALGLKSRAEIRLAHIAAELRNDAPGDIGATNARFALVAPGGGFSRPRIYPTDEYVSLADAISAYFADEQSPAAPTQAVLAVASPITGDRVMFTNNPWSFSIESLRQQLGLQNLRVINDFVACALAIPHLEPSDSLQVGPGAAVAGAPIGILGPGTGLGVSALVPFNNEFVPLESEGGHVTLAAETAREEAVLGIMRRRFDHVSAERVLSGPGLVNLYNALCELSGAPAAAFTAAQITDPGIDQEDPQAKQAKAMFCDMLGSVDEGAFNHGGRGSSRECGRRARPFYVAFAHDEGISGLDRLSFRDRDVGTTPVIWLPIGKVVLPL